MGKLTNAIQRWLDRRNENDLMRRFGGIQRCPWCKQWAQSRDGWHFKADPDNAMLDVLTCGVCQGTSLWMFGMGMHYVKPLAPPLPLLSDAGRLALQEQG